MKQLLDPILNEQIRHANWFNGRLLSAEALVADQAAQRHARDQLGRAIGAGVVFGLEVAHNDAAALPTVTVTRGLAVNRLGNTLELNTGSAESIDLELDTPAAPPATSAGLFAPCDPVTSVYINVGFYLLAVAPASVPEERVPLHDIRDVGVATSCGTRYNTAGVTFRMLYVDIDNPTIMDTAVAAVLKQQMALTTVAARSRVRNLMAHWCLGGLDSAADLANLYSRLMAAGPLPAHGLEQRLAAANVLSDCDVPLALLYWTGDGVQFVDMWTVRRLLDADPAPLLKRPRTHLWLERLHQFHHHLDDLLDWLAAAAADAEIQDYFRYVPPAALFPVRGTGSPRGFERERLFAAYTAHAPGSLRADQCVELLRRSATAQYVDLQATEAAVQIYGVDENHAAVAAGTAPQLYHLVASYSLQGPEAQDGVTAALRQAWLAYRELNRSRAFHPSGVTAEAIAARFAITDAARDVMDTAGRLAAAAQARALDVPAVLAAFSDLYVVQNELAALYRSDIPGTVNQAFRQSFGQALDPYLNDAPAPSVLGLWPAIDAGSLPLTVAAQKRINQFVGQWVGGTATGFIEVTYQSSPEGDQLVPNMSPDAVFPYHFLVANRTDRRLTIDLEATLSTGWPDSLRIQDESGATISSVTLDSDATQVAIVAITVPGDAEVGTSVTLTLHGSVPEPHDKQDSATHVLTVAESPGVPVVRSLTFTTVQTPPNPTNVTPNSIQTFVFDVRFAATEAPFEASFTTSVTLAGNSIGDWFIDFAGAPRERPDENTYRTRYQLIANAPTAHRVTVRVRTPLVRALGRDKVAVINLLTESVDLPDLVSAAAGPFTLILQGIG